MADRKVRMTLDLDISQRDTLARWAALTGVHIGQPKLSSAQVLRAVIDLLEPPAADASEREQLLRYAVGRAITERLVAAAE